MKTTSTDSAKLDKMVRRFRTPVYAFLLSRVRNPALAEDLTQEAMLKLVQKLPQLRADDRLESWVFRIVRNTLADYMRKNQRLENAYEQYSQQVDVQGGLDIPTAAELEEEQLRNALRRYIRSVVEDLPEPYREALLLTEYEGLTQVELAERLGIPISTAKARVQRARHKVKNVIELCCYWEADRYGLVTDCKPRTSAACECRTAA